VGNPASPNDGFAGQAGNRQRETTMNVPKAKVAEGVAALLDNLPAGTVVRLVVSDKGFRLSLRGVPPTYASVETARKLLADHLGTSGEGAIYALSQGPDELSAGLVCDTPAEREG
jgi:hypothetical protein